jgi:hypothetical protein
VRKEIRKPKVWNCIVELAEACISSKTGIVGPEICDPIFDRYLTSYLKWKLFNDKL